jgi:hypothetical protein
MIYMDGILVDPSVTPDDVPPETEKNYQEVNRMKSIDHDVRDVRWVGYQEQVLRISALGVSTAAIPPPSVSYEEPGHIVSSVPVSRSFILP